MMSFHLLTHQLRNNNELPASHHDADTEELKDKFVQ